MFRLFGKKDPSVSHILISDDAFASDAKIYAPVERVVDFVNRMMSDGQYRRWELPDEAMWIYHADYYFCQVCNGGHSQFLHNSRGNELIVRDALAALEAAGATEISACLSEMMHWRSEDPNRAREHNAFNATPKELNKIDDRFFAANRDHSYHKAMAAWIRKSPVVRIIPEAKVEAETRRLLDGNPARLQRHVDAQVDRLEKMISTPLLMGLHQAATYAGYRIERMNAGEFATFNGERTVRWFVSTSDGLRSVIEVKDLVAVFKQKDTRNPGDLEYIAKKSDLFPAIQFSVDLPVAVIALELLKRFGCADKVDAMAFIEIKDGTASYVLTVHGRDRLGMKISEKGAVLGEVTKDNRVRRHKINYREMVAARAAHDARRDKELARLKTILPRG